MYRSTASRNSVGSPWSRSARAMASCSTTPRRLPTWTVPDGVLESLTTCGPDRPAASSSAQNMGCASLASADGEDLVHLVARGHRHLHLVALLAAEQRPTHGRLVGDPALRGRRLGGTHDGVRLGPTGALELDGGADLDMGLGGVLVDDDRVLDE